MDIATLEKKEQEFERRIKNVERIESELLKKMKVIEETLHIKDHSKKRYNLLELLENEKQNITSSSSKPPRIYLSKEEEKPKTESERKLLKKQLLGIIKKKTHTEEKKGNEVMEKESKKSKIVTKVELGTKSLEKRKNLLRKGIGEILNKNKNEEAESSTEHTVESMDQIKKEVNCAAAQSYELEDSDDARRLLKALLEENEKSYRESIGTKELAEKLSVSEEKVREWAKDLEVIGIIEFSHSPYRSEISLRLRKNDSDITEEDFFSR